MKAFKFYYSLLALLLIVGLLFTTTGNLSHAQSRRQPPTTDQKKNKRPGETGQEGEKKEEAPPRDIINLPKEAEKITTSTNLVNIVCRLLNEKNGQIVNGLKKPNFADFSDGVPQTI